MNKFLIFIIVFLVLFGASNKLAKKYTESAINEVNYKENISKIYGEKDYKDYYS